MKSYVKTYLKYFDIGEQDLWNCECCGRCLHIQDMDIHHIQYRSKGVDNTINNLAAVCRSCHHKIHNENLYFSLEQSRINRE